MSGLIGEYVVLIRYAKPGNPEYDIIGTVYTLGPHWVITCYHMLRELDENGKFTVLWRNRNDTATEKEEEFVKGEAIKWWSEHLDLALISCSAPYKDAPDLWDIIKEKKPSTSTVCDCFGYSAQFLREKGRDPDTIPSRLTIGTSNTDARFAKVMSSLSLAKDKYWDGISGSPVFASDRLVGLVCRCIPHCNGACLGVVFICMALDIASDGNDHTLLQNVPGFWKTVDERRREMAKPIIEKILKENNTIYCELKLLCENEIDCNTPTQLAEILFKREGKAATPALT